MEGEPAEHLGDLGRECAVLVMTAQELTNEATQSSHAITTAGGILAGMWHWGNIGSFLAGLSTVVIALAAVRQGPAAVRAWIDAKNAQAEAAREQANDIQLERRRHLSGWSSGGVAAYGVTLVTEKDELGQAVRELTHGGPTTYVVLRVSEGRGTSVNRGHDLRQLIENQGLIARAPTKGETEAVRAGLDAMGIAHASY